MTEPTTNPDVQASVKVPDATLTKLVETTNKITTDETDTTDVLPKGLLSDRIYDLLKWTSIIVMPALATFVIGLGGIWNWPVAGSIAATITAISVLLGALLGLSSVKYSASK